MHIFLESSVVLCVRASLVRNAPMPNIWLAHEVLPSPTHGVVLNILLQEGEIECMCVDIVFADGR